MRVVLADDHNIVREGMQLLLADAQEVEIVGEAASGEELLLLLESVAADIALLDIEMPGMGGLGALQLLEERHPDLKVIILSMHDRTDYVRTAISRGADGYLLKSAKRDEVLTALEVVGSGGSYIQAELVAPLVATIGGGAPTADFALSTRERQVLQFLAQGLETPAIAAALEISEATVRTHVKNLFTRLDVHTRAEAVAVGLRHDLIE